MRTEPGEQLVEIPVADATRRPGDELGPIQPDAFVAVRLHWIVVRADPAPASFPDHREGVDHRPRPRIDLEVVEAAQHALTMDSRCRRVRGARRSLTSHRVRGSRHRSDRPLTASRLAICPTPVRKRRLAADLDPSTEVTGLDPGGLIPRHLNGPQEPEPPQQVHPIRALRGDGPPCGLEFVQILTDRPDNTTVGIDKPIRPPRVARLLEAPNPRHNQRREIPFFV